MLQTSFTNPCMDIHAWMSMHGFVKLVCNIVSHEIYAHHVKAGEKSVSKIGLKVRLDENNPHLYKTNSQELTLLSRCSFFSDFPEAHRALDRSHRALDSPPRSQIQSPITVSYTHLTLAPICSV